MILKVFSNPNDSKVLYYASHIAPSNNTSSQGQGYSWGCQLRAALFARLRHL